jgi:DNA end-binding protein Ku
LNFESQVKKPASFEDEIPQADVSPKEIELAESLVDASTEEEFDFSRFKDSYQNDLQKLIEAKVSGKKLASPPEKEAPQIINLMDALRKSLNQAGKARPKKKPASSGKRGHGPRPPSRRKTG